MPDSSPAAPLSPSPSSSSSPRACWAALLAYLNEWFLLPPGAEEALKILFLASLAHSIPECEPIWCMLVGVPGSGKTSIGIRCLSAFPGAYVMSGISENTLLSSFGSSKKARKEASLLHRLGPAPRILIKDFTTLLSKREHVRDEVFAQLRELHDGQLRSDRGNGESAEWVGKATVIAATTPAVERKWDAMRELGERFLIVRWPKGDPLAAGRFSRKQNNLALPGSGAARIKAEQLRLTSALIATFQGGLLASPPQPSYADGEVLDALAEVVALSRAQVIRDSHGKRGVIEVCAHESPTRISAALQGIVSCAALLHESDEVGPAELALARRIALDTIPARRARILSHVPHNGAIPRDALAAAAGVSKSTMMWQFVEMRHLGILEARETSLASSIALTDSFRRLREQAGLLPSSGNLPIRFPVPAEN